ncbi:FAD-binding oxidoreductase [Glacieibacterium frigidum]|uniref:D-lactate dehydrogenase (cytochrome) n=1 Tax=Glacieibacterium frigidum TaxID=2593303 RepID=A0A552UIH5_9SPHN|nr:FAD-binding oxidoreductase [Glacieibacterium frigidum]TRW18026.1 FAD-binding oxidoreductase [Glacieibacterium frigidum]
MATMPAPTPLDRLRAAVGADALITDAAECAYYAQDVHTLGPAPLAVFRPENTTHLAAGLAAAHAEGLAVVPRGGGMSYTRGYVADAPGALLIDMGGMSRILAVDADNMTVTVEAGCTWAALYAELHPRGLRTPGWGTLSGLRATVGGGMSQNGLFWGAARGSIASQALSFRVVLADGTVVTTGNGFLQFGPDLTALFAADAGALGIKAEVTLPLIPEAAALGYASFEFTDAASVMDALSKIARAGLATEAFGFDPFLTGQRMKRDSLAADAKSLLGMAKAQGGLWKGFVEGAKVVAAGRSFLGGANFSAHFITEGRNQASADADLAALTTIALAHGGKPVANTIPKVLRANPFPPPNSMLGPEGERWVPVHGIVTHGQAAPAFAAIEALFEARAAEMEALGIGAGHMLLTVGHGAFLIEPVFYYPGATAELHRRAVEPAHLARLKGFAANDAARALVDELRAAVIDIFATHGAAHFQIGRTYPLRAGSDPAAWALLGQIKAAVDPAGAMNPSALGL